MLSFIKKNKFFLLGILVLIFVVIINAFPRGYVLVGGDTTQFIEASSNLKRLFFEWNSIAIIFYSFFFLLDKMGISNTNQLSFYLGIFVLGSYLSFYLFLKLLFNRTNSLVKTILSLIYSLNLYTLYIFTYAWGYSHYQSLYIFIPLLIGLFVKFFQEKKFLTGALFVLALFLSSSGFGNPAFFLSLGIVLFLTIVVLVFLKIITIDRRFWKAIIFLASSSLLVNMYWMLPIIPQMGKGVSSLFSGNAIDFNWWLRHSANPIVDTLRLSQGNSWYFPNNFPYKEIVWTKNFFLFLTILPSLVLGFFFFYFKRLEMKERNMFIAFIILLLVLIMLIAKVSAPFEIINHFFYNIWGMNTLRGYEKFAIFSPFLFTIILLPFFRYLYESKLRKTFFLASLLILSTALPFFIGGIQTKLCARFYANKTEKKDYLKSDFSFLVKIPEEYYGIRKLVNTDSSERFFIAPLPYGSPEGAGWTTYPKWKLTGADITSWLYNPSLISPYDKSFDGKYAARIFEDYDSISPTWLPKLLGMMNAKYILYHLDAPEESVTRSLSKMRTLEKEGLVRNLEENDYFILYEIDPKYRLPYLSYQKESPDWRNDPIWIDRNAEKIIASSQEAPMREINPKKFEIDFEVSEFSNNLVLAEKFNPLWKAYSVDASGKETEIKEHFLARGYANGWKIENPEGIEKIIIEYYPIRLMWWGIWISSATVLFLLAYLIKYYYNICHPRPDRGFIH
ncbi:MAG: hypothetical protein ACOYS2_00035 [Patescibacteria group bacterium]